MRLLVTVPIKNSYVNCVYELHTYESLGDIPPDMYSNPDEDK